jgi:lipopolysaccharide cholinephosphotransferase
MPENRKQRLEMLDQISMASKKLGIDYFLAGTALLGAARYSSFIPGFDEIELWMTRPDYDRFISSAGSILDGLRIAENQVAVRTRSGRQYAYLEPTAQVQSSTSGGEAAQHISIVPLDVTGAPKSLIWKLHSQVCRKLAIGMRRVCEIPQKSFPKRQPGTGVLAKPVRKLLNRALTRYANQPTGYLATLASGKTLTPFPAKLFESTVEMAFEGRVVTVPLGYDKILGSLYGDYLLGKPDLEDFDKEHTLEIVQELQQIELGILRDIDAVCKKHNIEYFLGEGTMLGAIRHRGFIPWDDDIDLIMKRSEYDRFLDVAPKSLAPKYEVQHFSTVKKYWSPFIKVRLIEGNPRFRQDHIAHVTDHNGPLIDIFPMEYVPSEKGLDVRLQRLIVRILRSSLALRLGTSQVTDYRRRLLKIALRPLPLAFIHKILDQTLRKYNDQPREYIGTLASYHALDAQIIPAKCYDHAIMVDFEGGQYPIPVGYDTILSKVYGAYLEFPPEKMRVVKHHFIDIAQDQP